MPLSKNLLACYELCYQLFNSTVICESLFAELDTMLEFGVIYVGIRVIHLFIM